MKNLSLRLYRSLTFAVLVGTAAVSSGCSMGLPSCVDDGIATMRNKHLAKSAWLKRRSIYKETENCLCDFKTGFKDGYIAAIEGKAECPPALAPPKYWGVRYQSRSGRCCVNAWHTGWAHGAIAADQDGAMNIAQIVVHCPCGSSHAGGMCPNGFAPGGGQHSGYQMAPAEHVVVPPDSGFGGSGLPPAPVPSLANPSGLSPIDDGGSEVPVYLPGIDEEIEPSSL